MRKYATEFIGTFALVLTVACTVLTSAALAPLAIGSSLMIMVYAGGHVSGGHYNPAVSLAAFVRGRLPQQDLLPYWAAQFLGGAAAAGVAEFLIDPHGVKSLSLSGRTMWAGLVAELIFTFFLCYVVLNVATSKDHAVNSFYGLAIGFTVVVGAVAVGGVSNGAFNPAVALGILFTGIASWGYSWIYLIGCFAGGAAAGLFFKWQNPEDA